MIRSSHERTDDPTLWTPLLTYTDRWAALGEIHNDCVDYVEPTHM